MNQQQVGVVQMTTAMALSGGVGLWATWAAMPSVGVVFWRCAFGFIALLGFMLFTGRIHRGWISKPQMLWSLAAGTALVLNWVCFFQSFHYVSIGISTIVYQAQPLLVVMGGMVFFRERMGLNRWLWLGLGLVGMVALVLARGEVSLNGDHYLLGIALSLAAASFYAAGTLIAKRMPKTPAQNPCHHGDLDAGIGGHAHHVGLGRIGLRAANACAMVERGHVGRGQYRLDDVAGVCRHQPLAHLCVCRAVVCLPIGGGIARLVGVWACVECLANLGNCFHCVGGDGHEFELVHRLQIQAA